MKVTEHIRQSDGPLLSFEILPPTKGSSIVEIFETLDPLMEFKPPYINITYHSPEVSLRNRPDGLLEKRVIRKRPGTVAISSAIRHRYKVDVVPHLICGGFNREETEDALIDLNYLNIHNILVIRGDADHFSGRFTPNPGGHEHAVDLLRQVMDMNEGRYLDDELKNPTPTCFSVGVAGYPEKHAEAPNMDTDIRYLKEKIDAGAEYIVTQMFFDNSKFFSFVKKCREAGIEVPIIPGLKPVSIKKHMTLLPQTFKVDLPSDLTSEIEKCRNNESVRELGIEWAVNQSKELLKAGFPVIHFFTMGRSDNIRRIAGQII